MNTIIKNILVSILMISFSLAAYSQENSKKGERGPFMTNEKAFDNTFIGVAGGVNFNYGDYDKGKASPALDIYFGKWWTPQVGARIGYSGIQLKGSYANGSDEKWNMSFIHTDLMWNICNAIQGYRSDRVWNVIPFIGFGILNHDGKDMSGANANNWFVAGSAGIYNTFTVGKRVDITLEGRYAMAKNEYDGDLTYNHDFDRFFSVTAGVAFKLGKVGFVKHTEADYAPYENTIADLKNALADANDKLAATDAELKALQDRLAAAKDEEGRLRSKKYGVGGVLELFFKKNSAELDAKELSILDTYMKTAGSDMTFVVTGTTDSATGSKSYNQKLSEKRAAYVANLLSEKYGVKSIVSDGAGEVDTHKNPVMNRTASIVLK